jgi:uncharacterized protein YjdB
MIFKIDFLSGRAFLHVPLWLHKNVTVFVLSVFIFSSISLHAQTNVALVGNGATGYTWPAMATSADNSSKTAAAGVNDNNTGTDVALTATTAANMYQAAGVTWSSAQSNITSVKFYNGTASGTANLGYFSSNLDIQYTTNGSTWVSSGWTISGYPYTNGANGQNYTMSGTALNNVLGIRVVGLIATSGGAWVVREVQALGATVTGVTITAPTNVSVKAGGTYQLVATVAPANAVNQAVTWSSGATGTATVNATGLVTGVASNMIPAVITVTTSDQNKTATANVLVFSTLSLSPAAASLATGKTQTMVATSDAGTVTNTYLTWSSSNTSIATVSTAGVVTAGATTGTVTITAKTTDGAIAATSTFYIVSALTLSPSNITVGTGSTYALTATSIPAGSPANSYVWTSAATGTATVNTSGVVTGVTAGNTTITVKTTDGSLTGTSTVYVVGGITITPSTASLNVTKTTTMVVKSAAGVTIPNTNVTWTTSNAAIATVSTAGVVTAVAGGTVTITATTTDGAYSSAASISVISALTVNPTNITIGTGNTFNLNTITTTTPSGIPASNLVWTSGNTTYTTVNASGVATGVAAGNTTITVKTTDGSLTGTANVYVVGGITITPSTASLNVTKTTTMVVKGSAGVTVPNANVTWTSSDPTIATVSAAGVVTAIAGGTVTITATTTDGAYSSTASISVISALTINPTAITIGTGNTFNLNTIITTTPSGIPASNLLWASGNTTYATVSSAGIATGVAAGGTALTVRTTDGSLTGTATVYVVGGITLTPSSGSLNVSTNTTMVVKSAAGATIPNINVTWATSNAAIATVTSAGVVTAVAAGGPVTITATTTDGMYSATATFYVISGLAVSPTAITVGTGSTYNLYTNTTTTPAGIPAANLVWTSAATATATVSSVGVVGGVAAGNTTVTVKTTDGSLSSGNVSVYVVGGITLTPVTGSLNVTKTTTMVVKSTAGATIPNANVTWATSNAAIATVSSAGVVTGVAAGGPVTITATTTDGLYSATATFYVISGLTVSPTAITLGVGATSTIIATTTPSAIPAANLVWASGATGTATVSAGGVVTAVAVGNTTVTAKTTDGSLTGTTSVYVVGGITISPTGVAIYVGKTKTMAVTSAGGITVPNANVTWTTSDATLATVSAAGVVTATATNTGTVTITATTTDGAYTSSATLYVISGLAVTPTAVTVGIGGTATLTPVITPAGTPASSVAWSSNATATATVNSTGVVTGVAVGNTTINVKTTDGTTVTSSVYVVGGITITPTSGSIDVTKTVTMVVKSTAGVTVPNANVTWTSSNTAIATVSTAGVVTGVASGGPVTITATTTDGTYSATATFYVISGLAVSPTAITLGVGNTSNITATSTPAGTPATNLVWASAAAGTATVSTSGIVTAVAVGNTTVTAKTTDGNLTGTTSVYVVGGITVTPSTAAIYIGKTKTMTVTSAGGVTVPNANVTWTTSDATIATVSTAGVVTASATNTGTVTITATTSDGMYSSSSTIYVVSGITITPATDSLPVGNSFLLTISSTPSTSISNTSVTWSSSNTAIATVSAAGVVTASGTNTGTVTITAKTVDGNKSATSTIYVYLPATGASVSPTSATIAVGDPPLQLVTTFTPSNATNQNVYWTSSNPAVAVVNGLGLVTGVSAGTVTISGVTADGGFPLSSSITVTGAASYGYIYMHDKSINEAKAVNTLYTLYSGSSPTGTPLGTFTLNDFPDNTVNIYDLGAGHGIANSTTPGGNGELWAIGGTAVSSQNGTAGNVYRKISTSTANTSTTTGVTAWSQITSGTGITAATAIDGAYYNQFVYISGGNVYFYNAGTSTQLYSGANATAVSAGGGIIAMVANTGRIYTYPSAYTTNAAPSTTGGIALANWNSVVNASNANSAVRIDINSSGSSIVYDSTSGGVNYIYTIALASGVRASLGTPSTTSPGIADVAYDDNGGIYATSPVNSSDAVSSYNSSTGTWTGEPEARGVKRITGGAGGQTWGIVNLGAFPETIYTRSIDNTGKHVWLDDERMNVTSGQNVNSIMIEVPAGTYTVQETLPDATWDVGRFNIYDPTGNTTGSVATNAVTFNVSAGESVNTEFISEKLNPKSIALTCVLQPLQSFNAGTSSVVDSTFGTAAYGTAYGGTSYHYYAGSSPQDGYYYLVDSLIPGTNWFGGHAAKFYDHTGNNGYFMVINAAYALDEFFRQRVTNLVPGIQYTISFYMANVSQESAIKPNITYGLQDLNGNVIASNTSGDLNTTSWTLESFTFTATATTADLFLRNNNIGGSGNDLGIDDISLNPYITPLGPNTISPTIAPNICIGTDYIFSNAQSPGTWSHSQSAITTLFPIGSNVIVDGIMAGKDTITYTYTNGNGCVSTQQSYIVVSAPPVVKVTDQFGGYICMNQTDSLYTAITTTSTAPYAYSWSATPAGSGLTVGSPQTANAAAVTPVGGNTYTYTDSVTDAVGCSAADFVNVVVSPHNAPTITVTGSNICLGSSISDLTANFVIGSTGTYTYLWTAAPGATSGIISSGGSENDNIQSPNPTPTAAGTYTYNVKVNDGFCNVYAGNNITVYSLPAPIIQPVCSTGIPVGQPGWYTYLMDSYDNPANISAYAWSSNNSHVYYYTDATYDDATKNQTSALAQPYITVLNANVSTFYLTVKDINGCQGSSSFTPATSSDACSVILPVTWLDFTVIKQGKTALLNWSTATEINNNHFEIERSSDGVNWDVLGNVPGSNNSTQVQQYSYVDDLPINGTNYYRIKQVDNNGHYTYSPVKKLVFAGDWLMKLYPNPALEFIVLEFNNAKEEQADISIHDVLGNKVFEGRQAVVAGYNKITLSKVALLPPGTYLLTFITPTNTFKAKFVKGSK